MFSNNSERDIHLFQDGSRKEGMHHGSRLAEQAGKLHARVWRLESSQWTAHFLPPVPAVSRLLGASSLNSSTVSLIYPAWVWGWPP